MNAKNSDTPHFNVADVIIIVALIAVITAFTLRVYNILGVEDEPTQVRIDFETTVTDDDNISFKEKTKLYYAADDSLVGYIESYVLEDTVQYAYNENGDLVRARVPGKKTIKGTIVLDCEEAKSGFYLGGTHLLSEGDTIKLYTTTREMDFNIKKITELEKENETSGQTSATTKATTAASTTAAAKKQ